MSKCKHPKDKVVMLQDYTYGSDYHCTQCEVRWYVAKKVEGNFRKK